MADDVRAKEHADDFALARVTPDKQKHWFGIAVQPDLGHLHSPRKGAGL